MRRAVMGSLLMVLALAVCDDDYFVLVDEGPAAPRDLVVSYYGGVVTVGWELRIGVGRVSPSESIPGVSRTPTIS